MTRPLVYGAYGYTGELVAREAVERGLEPILAGRRERPLRDLAEELGTEYRVASLEELETTLADIAVLVHCAGPFEETSEPAVDACLATGTHYVDITGEIPTLEAIHAADDRAREAGVTLLPGAGFDVVPSDCLAARLHAELPEADTLRLAFGGLSRPSPGTARTAARILGGGVTVRENGALRTVPFGSRVREIDTGTGHGPTRMGVVPWGDVSTAYHTTGIGTVEVYAPAVMGLSPAAQRLLGRLQPVFGLAPVRRALATVAGWVAEGPDAEERAEGSASFWGAVTDGDRTVTGRVHTPEPYRFTAAVVVEITERVAGGDAPVGSQTPAGAFGPELVTAVEGARFEAVGE